MRFHRLLSGLICLALAVTVYGRNVKLIYVAHDVDTPVDKLMENISYSHDMLDDNPEDGDRVIVYMSSGTNPIIADMRSGNRDEDNYERVMHEFERNYHDTNPEYDAERIIDLFEEEDFLNSTGGLGVDNLVFEFYVTPSFWTNGYNNTLISSLFYALGLEPFVNKDSPLFTREVRYKVYLPNMEDQMKCLGKNNEPFGANNPNNINSYMKDSGVLGAY